MLCAALDCPAMYCPAAGLAGFYFVRKFFPTYDTPKDTGPELAGLPYPPPGGANNEFDILELPLAIQDRVFDSNGQLWYPQVREEGEG
jgi:hypothetical protein